MRTRTRIANAVRSTPARPLLGWALLNVLPGAADRRHHKRIDDITAEVIRFALRDGGVGIDVGAHTGELLQHFVAASSATHLAIEPIPMLAAGLRRRFAESALVVETLVGSTEDVLASGGVGVLHVQVDDPGYSSVGRTTHPRLRSSKTADLRTTIRTLDNVAAEALTDIDAVRIIKIDVEGFELHVLRGADHLLRGPSPVIIFEHESMTSELASDSVEIYRLLAGHGYHVVRLDAWPDIQVILTESAFVDLHRSGVSYFLACQAASRGEIGV